jgi:hypothetical protein
MTPRRISRQGRVASKGCKPGLRISAIAWIWGGRLIREAWEQARDLEQMMKLGSKIA